MPKMPNNVYKPYKVNKSKNWLRNDKDVSFYNSTVWRKLSKDYKQRHPVCELKDCTQPSYYTDHIMPISEGGPKLYESNLQALCKSCNAKKTQKQGAKVK